MGSSTPKDGPSAGGAIALALASALSEHAIRRDVAMTGEIDTHGRIKAVGGLDIKLETAVDAGCKTLIIPMENLRGEGGIERLPDALKNELQILSYPEWKGEHDPFDYERHVLQIVSVDHIAQAADIAFIDEAELKTLEETFAQNALSFAKSLKDFPKDLTSCFSLLYAKSMGELNLEGSEDIFWEGCSCIFLSRSDVKADILKKFPALETRSPIKNSIPTQEDIRAIIEEIKASISKDHKKPLKISLVAPFYFLARSGIHTEDYPPTSSFEGLKLFANNYTAQGIKIKACKPALNRLYCLFSRLNVKQIDDCPFLKRRDGIYTVDLSFIPEKYSLDVKHAEKILNRCLKRWLTAVSEV
jgi:ATP-dependent Lon protease